MYINYINYINYIIIMSTFTPEDLLYSIQLHYSDVSYDTRAANGSVCKLASCRADGEHYVIKANFQPEDPYTQYKYAVDGAHGLCITGGIKLCKQGFEVFATHTVTADQVSEKIDVAAKNGDTLEGPFQSYMMPTDNRYTSDPEVVLTLERCCKKWVPSTVEVRILRENMDIWAENANKWIAQTSAGRNGKN